MPKLVETMRSWGSEQFAGTLKREILALDPIDLSLQLAASQGGIVPHGATDAMVLNFEDGERTILARIGVFFTETVGGCSCGDDPMETQTYCELQVRIDKATAEAELSLA